MDTESLLIRSRAIAAGTVNASCPAVTGKVLRVRSYLRDGFWVRGDFVVAQATLATLVGIPFFIQLHVNGTCDPSLGADTPCDSYEDSSVEGGDGWEAYFEPMGGVPASQVLASVGEANIIELSEVNASWIAFYGIRLVGDDFSTYEPSNAYADDWTEMNEDRLRIGPRVQEFIRARPEIEARVDAQWETHVLGSSTSTSTTPLVVGVHMRGTDAFNFSAVTPEQFFPFIDQYISAHDTCSMAPTPSCQRVVVFLATDDSTYRNRTMAHYGDRLAMQNAGEIHRSNGTAGVWDSADNSRALQRGLEIVVDTLMLSRCDFIIKPRSAVSEWAIFLNANLINNSYTIIDGATGSGGPLQEWMHGIEHA